MSNKQNTAVIEGRCDHRDLATCHEWLAQRGVFVNTKSALFGEIVGQMAEILRTKLGGRTFDNHTAFAYLNRELGTVNRSGRGKRTMAQALEGESIDLDYRERILEALKKQGQIGERLIPKPQSKEEVEEMLRASGTLADDTKKEGGDTE